MSDHRGADRLSKRRKTSGGAEGDSAAVPVWLDCDPGHDDAMAIILAGHSSSIELLGVSTVVGNQTVEKVTNNALRTLEASGLGKIDVVQGAGKPLMRDPPLCPEIHGESGLSPLRDSVRGSPSLTHAAAADGHHVRHTAEEQPEHSFPEPRRCAVAGKAAAVIFQRIQEEHKRRNVECVIVCTASLTNIALLVALYPEVVNMARVVLMGGAMGIGNTGPVMEFNIQTDPEAASMVFNAGWSVTMIPVEVTHTALVTPEVLRRIQSRATPFCDTVGRLLLFFQETYRDVFQFEHPPLHDPCAVAYCIAPHLFTVKEMRVDIETKSELSAGQTVCDVWGQSSKPKNAAVATEMNVPEFWNLMVAAIHAADDCSTMNRVRK